MIYFHITKIYKGKVISCSVKTIIVWTYMQPSRKCTAVVTKLFIPQSCEDTLGFD